jgi:hypothetical protein
MKTNQWNHDGYGDLKNLNRHGRSYNKLNSLHLNKMDSTTKSFSKYLEYQRPKSKLGDLSMNMADTTSKKPVEGMQFRGKYLGKSQLQKRTNNKDTMSQMRKSSSRIGYDSYFKKERILSHYPSEIGKSTVSSSRAGRFLKSAIAKGQGRNGKIDTMNSVEPPELDPDQIDFRKYYPVEYYKKTG